MSSVPNSIIAAHARVARAQGVDIEASLARFGLDPQAVLSERGRSDIEAFGRWVGTQWRERDDESGGFCPRRMKSGTFAMANHAVITAGTLRQAWQRSAQFYALVNEALTIELVEQGHEARLRFAFTETSPHDRRVFYDALLIIWLRWGSWLVDAPLLPERVHLGFDWPPYRDEYDVMYGCPVYANQADTALILSRDELDRPLARTASDLPEFLQAAPVNLLTQYRRDDSLAQQVRRLLRSSGDPMALDQGQVAERLSMSPATLRRRLQREGTGFQALKDQWQRGRAIELLKASDASLSAIAHQLGFSEASAFHRAFKRWTRFNPGDYRRERLSESVN